MVRWYSLWSFGIFFPFWYVSTKKNLATLVRTTEIFARGQFCSARARALKKTG
jgi:hypothetical protein